MEISDIQQINKGNIEITFCNEPDFDDCLKIIISQDTMWQISKYCSEKLSYAAKLKRLKQ
jgi:hypothetical protein